MVVVVVAVVVAVKVIGIEVVVVVVVVLFLLSVSCNWISLSFILQYESQIYHIHILKIFASTTSYKNLFDISEKEKAVVVASIRQRYERMALFQQYLV